MSEWETFCDESYFHLWRVRRKDERGFENGVHVNNGEEAMALVELLNHLERELAKARRQASVWEKLALREASINGARLCGKEEAKWGWVLPNGCFVREAAK